jgi:cell division protein DivIC
MRQILIGIYAMVFVAIAVGSTTFFWQTRSEYLRQKEIARVTNERLLVTEARLSEQQKILQRLETDPAFVETLIRRRLGYVKPDELIFRFEK